MNPSESTLNALKSKKNSMTSSPNPHFHHERLYSVAMLILKSPWNPHEIPMKSQPSPCPASTSSATSAASASSTALGETGGLAAVGDTSDSWRPGWRWIQRDEEFLSGSQGFYIWLIYDIYIAMYIYIYVCIHTCWYRYRYLYLLSSLKYRWKDATNAAVFLQSSQGF